MTTKLQGQVKRALSIGDQAYTLTVDEVGLKLAGKGHRHGLQLRWADLISGDSALAAARQASVSAIPKSSHPQLDSSDGHRAKTTKARVSARR